MTDRLDLVAPELRAALDYFPKIDFGAGIEPYRGNIFGAERPPLPPELVAVEHEERLIAGHPGDPDVRILIYTPPGVATAPRPAILEIHGGGFVIGNADMGDAGNRALALQLGCVVVSVDYRLAPETVWPGALHDCYAALTWLHDNAGALGVDPTRIAIAGGSAGGGHAAALAIHARDQAGPAICFQLLDFPMLDDRTCSAADPHPYCGDFGWTPEMNRFGWRSLLGTEPGGPDVSEAMAPARTRDLSRLPPAYIMVGALDLFLEEDLEYARRLARVGVPVELHVIPGAYHGFGLAQTAPQTQQAIRWRMDALARALGVTLA
ncbi:alpha/beta hydrolase [Novosphingobium sp. PS1R-30]|uniref:Alpha/beta hydrolase n=1 Tax=Novosphingobium anseongense TaxID=3133436 RepID=A0ABU8RXN3_9SPHN